MLFYLSPKIGYLVVDPIAPLVAPFFVWDKWPGVGEVVLESH